jgi:hypothetical protein
MLDSLLRLHAESVIKVILDMLKTSSSDSRASDPKSSAVVSICNLFEPHSIS